jgi:putative membrane protein
MIGGGGGWMWLWPILVLLGVLLLAYVGLRLVQSGRTGSAPAAESSRSARQILDERYAGGEIDEQDYRTRRDALK